MPTKRFLSEALLLAVVGGAAVIILTGETPNGEEMRRLAVIATVVLGTGLLYIGHCIQESNNG